MTKYLHSFATAEDGAVTVDWVVLTAAIVSLAGVVILQIHGSTGNAGDNVRDKLVNISPGGE